MLSNLESTIQQIINTTSADMAKQIATAVRQALAAEFLGNSAVAAPAKRGPGRPKKVPAPVAPLAQVPPTKAAKPTKLKRRTEAQVARDDAKILEAVKSKAGLRAVALKKLVKLPSQNIASGLKRLREAGKIKAKGQRSATTYTAV